MGVVLAGFATMGQPAAMAGSILWAARLSGKLKGEIAHTAPTGSYEMNPRRLTPPGCAGKFMVFPSRVRAIDAENLRVWAHLSTSPSANLMGLPASLQMMSASSCFRLPMLYRECLLVCMVG